MFAPKAQLNPPGAPCSLSECGFLLVHTFPVIFSCTCNQGCGVGGKMSNSNSDLSKTFDSDTNSRLRLPLFLITWMTFECHQFCRNQQSIKTEIHSKNSLLQEKLQKNLYHFNLESLWLRIKKWFNSIFGVRVGKQIRHRLLVFLGIRLRNLLVTDMSTKAVAKEILRFKSCKREFMLHNKLCAMCLDYASLNVIVKMSERTSGLGVIHIV